MFESQDVMVPFKVQEKYLEGVREGGERVENVGELYEGAEWDGDLVRFERYCHVYKEGEIEEISGDVDGLEVVGGGWEAGNWWVQFKRVK